MRQSIRVTYKNKILLQFEVFGADESVITCLRVLLDFVSTLAIVGKIVDLDLKPNNLTLFKSVICFYEVHSLLSQVCVGT